ncbi:hypothetical protein [Dermatobacter hominis]|uniref:hypothetical protein n=1 Tax=Dermatobacter hominis TaxID=2884263 RepID=UPI001D130166|nr:hypothetical protein [Dermatobacter hominis]UDY34027.1 hypothetical protein LH044_11795 [Dermatobacter hominis]
MTNEDDDQRLSEATGDNDHLEVDDVLATIRRNARTFGELVLHFADRDMSNSWASTDLDRALAVIWYPTLRSTCPS